MNTNQPLQLRITDVIHAVFKRRILIAVLTAVGLVVGILLSIVSYMRGEMAKEYAITSSFAVTSVTQDGTFTSKTGDPNQNDIYLAENMVDSVIYVMQSDRVINTAIDKLNLVGISAKDIASNLSLRQYNETQIVEMTLYWRSAEEGVQILNALNTVSPNILIETLKIGGVSVVNNPTARYLIGGSVNASMWVYMAVLGMMAGIGFSVLQLLLQPTLINPKDVEQVLGLEIIGEIPENKVYFGRKHKLLEEDDSEEATHIREAFASSAHILHNRLSKEAHQRIYVTSAAPNEGKTSTVANLAVQLSDLEHKVLLIDLDVHNPSLGTLFLDKVDYAHSLNALYRGEAVEADVITHLTGYLDLLPSMLEHRTLPLDDAMLSLILKLSADYDYVVMDTSPVGRTADTMNLNQIAQSAIFVVRYDTTSMSEIRDSLERMDKSGIRVIGSIVNGTKRLGQTGYGYAYYGQRRGKKTHRQTENIVLETNTTPQTAVQTAVPPVEVPVQPIVVPAEEVEEPAIETVQPVDTIVEETVVVPQTEPEVIVEEALAEETNNADAAEHESKEDTFSKMMEEDIEEEQTVSQPEEMVETDDLPEQSKAEDSFVELEAAIQMAQPERPAFEPAQLPPLDDDIFKILSGFDEEQPEKKKGKSDKKQDKEKKDKKDKKKEKDKSKKKEKDQEKKTDKKKKH